MMFKSPFVFRIVHILLIGIKRFRFPCSVKSKVPIAIWAKLFNANDMLWDIKIVACAFDHVWYDRVDLKFQNTRYGLTRFLCFARSRVKKWKMASCLREIQFCFCLVSTMLLFSNRPANIKVLNIESTLHNELPLKIWTRSMIRLSKYALKSQHFTRNALLPPKNISDFDG